MGPSEGPHAHKYEICVAYTVPGGFHGFQYQACYLRCSITACPTFVRPLQHDKVAFGPVRLVAVVDVVVELLNVALHAHEPE